MLRKIKKSDKTNFLYFASQNKSLINLFNDFIKEKKLAFISEENDLINGLIYVYKKDDYYLKIFANSKKVTNNLLKILFWHWKKEIYVEINEDDKTGFILKSNGFRINSKKDDTFLLSYNPKYKGKRYGKRNNK